MKRSLIISAIIVWVAVIQASLVYAQAEHPMTLLKKLRKANNSKSITYDYQVKLLNANDGIIKDSVSGKMYKNGTVYLDSNKMSITARSKDYYFNLNKYQKTATVLSVELLNKKMGFKSDRSAEDIIAIPDSILLKYGKINVTTLPDGDYHVDIHFEELMFEQVVFEIDHMTMLVKYMEIVSVDEMSGQDVTYKRVYAIRNIKHQFDTAILDTKRLFTINDGKPVLNKKYADYHINTITN